MSMERSERGRGSKLCIQIRARGMTIGTFEEESSGYIVYRVPDQNTLGITRDWDDEEISSFARAVDVCDEAER